MQEKEYVKNKVTVVIPVYNEERFLRQCLESVVDQVDCVIIGDNASTDGTEAICREFTQKYDHIFYLRHEKNLGSVKNLCLCYEKVKTEFVFHIGAHDVIPRNYVYRLKETLLINPDAIVAYANTIRIDENGKPFGFYERPDIKTLTTGIQTLANEFPDSFKMGSFDLGLDINTTWAKFLADENPNVRVACFMLHQGCNICNIIYGMMRSSYFVSNVSLLWPTTAGPDAIFLFNLLLMGKFVFCAKTSFLRYEAHSSANDYMQRITGNHVKFDIFSERVKFLDIILDVYNQFLGENKTELSQKLINFLKTYRENTRLLVGIPQKISTEFQTKWNLRSYRIKLRNKFKFQVTKIFNRRILRENEQLKNGKREILEFLIQIFNNDLTQTANGKSY